MVRRTILVNASYAPSLLAFRGPLLQRMVEGGHRVHASAPGLSGVLAEQVGKLGVETHDVRLSRTGLDPLKDLAYFLSLRALIRRTGADLVLGYTIKPCIWGSLAARAERVESASLVTGLGYSFMPGGGGGKRLVRALSRRLWHRATAANRVVIFQNPDDLRDFITAGALLDATKARLVNGSGVDLQVFARAGLPCEARFLMVARLLGNKGVRQYAQAAKSLRAEGLAAHFSLAGFFDEGPDGVKPRELEQWAADGLTYLGPLDDVRPALTECSIYVLPSYREGTPRTVLEAMAMGRPVITSDAPGCRETIVHGVSGLLVPPRDAIALAAAMRELALDPSRRAAMGEAAWTRCRRRYDVNLVNEAMLGCLGLT